MAKGLAKAFAKGGDTMIGVVIAGCLLMLNVGLFVFGIASDSGGWVIVTTCLSWPLCGLMGWAIGRSIQRGSVSTQEPRRVDLRHHRAR